MLRYLAILTLVFSYSALADQSKKNPKWSEEVQNLIDIGKANGLQAVNEGRYQKDNPKFRDGTGLSYTAPPGGWKPNAANYDRVPSSTPDFFYRTVRDCKSKKILDEQLIFTYNGYSNYIGGSRYQEQCVLDGTADTFYEESDDRLR